MYNFCGLHVFENISGSSNKNQGHLGFHRCGPNDLWAQQPRPLVFFKQPPFFLSQIQGEQGCAALANLALDEANRSHIAQKEGVQAVP